MSIFNDKKYQELDWISQAVEPIQTTLNDSIAAIPDEFNLTCNDILALHAGGVAFNKMDILKKLGVKESGGRLELLATCFNLSFDDGMVLDPTTGTMTGTMILSKISSSIEEAILLKHIGVYSVGELRLNCREHINVARMNEIAEIIGGCEPLLRTKSIDKKLQFLMVRMRSIFNDNEWNIKDFELADRVCLWIAKYIVDGNLAALNNFCKIKVMTHKGNAIYSLEEEQL